MRIHAVAFAIALAAFLAGPVGGAQEVEGWGYDVWHELMSPFCPGRTLADCPSPQADKLRAWILAQEQEGRDKEAVVAELYQRFGEVVRQSPAPTGVGIAAYLIPILIFLAGGGLVALFLRRQAAHARPRPAAGGVVQDLDLERVLEEEIGHEAPPLRARAKSS